MRDPQRNLLFGKQLEFGDKNQIRAAFKIDTAAQHGFIVSEDNSHFKCFKCDEKLYYDKEYECCDCEHFTHGSLEADDHDDDCASLMCRVIDQKIKCRNCKASYEIKEDLEEDYGHGFIVGLDKAGYQRK